MTVAREEHQHEMYAVLDGHERGYLHAVRTYVALVEIVFMYNV